MASAGPHMQGKRPLPAAGMACDGLPGGCDSILHGHSGRSWQGAGHAARDASLRQVAGTLDAEGTTRAARPAACMHAVAWALASTARWLLRPPANSPGSGGTGRGGRYCFPGGLC